MLEIICDLGKILQKKKRILIKNHQVVVKLDSVMKYFTYFYKNFINNEYKSTSEFSLNSLHFHMIQQSHYVKMIFMRNCFKAACYLAAFVMTIYWCYKFWLDEDLCLVDYKPFDNTADVDHPMLSLCFLNPLNESKLMSYNATFTEAMYLDFIKGISVSAEMKVIDHEDVRIKLTDYYHGNIIMYKNGTEIEEPKTKLPYFTFSGFYYGNFLQCLGLKTKNNDIEYMYLGLNSSIFPNRMRPDYGHKLSVITFLHLPNKIFLYGTAYKEVWPERFNNREYSMDFILNQVEVLKRRNKRNFHCLHDSLNYDETIWMNHLEKVGCRAPHQDKGKNLPICSTPDQIKQAIFEFQGIHRKIPHACTTIENINFRYEESYVDWGCEECFWIGVIFPFQFKEIIQVKAVDIQTMIGNAGAYIGILLGVAFLQIPSFLDGLAPKIKRFMSTKGHIIKERNLNGLNHGNRKYIL